MPSMKNDNSGNYIGGDAAAVFNSENRKALMDTQDLIGVVLRVHFSLEELLNIWCNKITNCDDFFDFDNSVSFALKLKIANKLGLPSDLSNFFKLFNTLRNKFAHRANYTISNSELNNLRYAVENIHVKDIKEVSKIYLGDKLITSWDIPNITNIQKLILIHYTFDTKALKIFDKEFKKRGISFSYLFEEIQ